MHIQWVSDRCFDIIPYIYSIITEAILKTFNVAVTHKDLRTNNLT